MSQEPSETRSLSFSAHVSAPPSQLYRAFTNSTSFREWLCDTATTGVREGGHVFLAWNDGYNSRGNFTSLKTDQEVAFTWHGTEPAATAVTVRLSAIDGGTAVELAHSGLGAGDAWEMAEEEFNRGWQISLENLKSVIETGEDLRFTRRPMLGVLVGELNADSARELGVPTDKGVRLDNVIEGMGAAAAGLQANDVLVQVGDGKISDYASLQTTMQRHRAGETVHVEFYRHSERKSVEMLLHGRPLPEIPWNGAALADRVRERYAGEFAELREFLSEVSDEEAGVAPALGQWCIKDVLSHLIHSEQGQRNYMLDVLGGHEPLFDDYRGNMYVQIAGTRTVYPTMRDLLDLLAREQQETVAMIANLPEESLANRAGYWRIAYNLLESPYHHRIHMEQMQEALAAARGDK
jgi:uncharacterized protein YndB with AHSA1/START domain